MWRKIKFREEAVKSGRRQHAQFFFWKLRRFFFFFLVLSAGFSGWEVVERSALYKSLDLEQFEVTHSTTPEEKIQWDWLFILSLELLSTLWFLPGEHLLETLKVSKLKVVFFFWRHEQTSHERNLCKTFSSLGSSDSWNKSNPQKQELLRNTYSQCYDYVSCIISVDLKHDPTWRWPAWKSNRVHTDSQCWTWGKIWG